VTEEVLDDEDDEDEWDEQDEPPDDSISCPLLDTPFHSRDCALCGDRGWVTEDAIEEYLGTNRIACLFCGGAGWGTGAGPITWTCDLCLGTGQMPVAVLEEEPLRGEPIVGQVLSGADLQGLDLDRLVFTNCNFSDVNFDGADLTGTSFEACLFTGANPEQASSLDGTRLLVEGLSEAQLANCVSRGAVAAHASSGWHRRSAEATDEDQSDGEPDYINGLPNPRNIGKPGYCEWCGQPGGNGDCCA
jgi:hypothetical protein